MLSYSLEEMGTIVKRSSQVFRYSLFVRYDVTNCASQRLERRFVWSNWDVNELRELKAGRFEGV